MKPAPPVMSALMPPAPASRARAALPAPGPRPPAARPNRPARPVLRRSPPPPRSPAPCAPYPDQERRAGHPVLPRERQRQPLLHELADRVDAFQRRRLGLRRGNREQRPSLGIERIPRAIRVAPGADDILDKPPLGVTIEAFAVDRHRG